MKRSTWLVGLSLLLTLATNPPAQGGVNTSAMIAAAADADRSGDVSAQEWQDFLGQVDPDGDGNLDRRVVKVWLLGPGLDQDRNGTLQIEDLNQFFAALDQDGDGSLQSEETSGRGGRGRGGRGGRGGGRRGGGGGGGTAGLVRGVILQAADVDEDGAVTAEEWRAFLAAADPEGTGDLEVTTIVTWIEKAETTVSTNRNTGLGVNLMTMDSNLDMDRNGTLTIADLNQAFTALDRNGDLALQADEVRPPVTLAGGRGRGRGGRGGGRGGGVGFRTPNEADFAKPPLMPFQRSLEDALAMVEETGKPLLICVNMDDEPASESLAAIRYRSPEWVDLASGFIPVLASPDRRNPRDYDDRGRRIVDAKFGRIINPEHIDIEPALFERYFQGQRVAPRHLAVDKDGNILFDIYLTNELSVVDDALRQYGNRDVQIPRPEVLNERELLASPDAGHRDFLEQLFVRGSEEDRLRLAGLALSSARRTQHTEILRMALADPAKSVRLAAVKNAMENPVQMPMELYPVAFRACENDPVWTSLLLDSLQEQTDVLEDDALRGRALRLKRVFSGLSVRSRLLDVDRWRGVLEGSTQVSEPPLSDSEIEDLDRQLDELADRRRQDPSDPEISVRIAELTMRYARIRILTNQDPTFLLEDTRMAALRSTSHEAPHGRGLGYAAWASYLVGDIEGAISYATQALPHLLGDAGTPLVAEVLSAFALSRTGALYTLMGTGSEWPATWVSDINAAYDILLDHPSCTEEQVLAYVNWLTAIEAYSLEPGALRRGLARFPLSAGLHERWREQLLRDGGAEALESAYAALDPEPGNAATITWYAGLASIVAAERQIQNKHTDGAVDAYTRSITSFRSSVAQNPGFRDSSVHYISLGLAGRGRLRLEAGQLDESLTDLRDSIAENPATATWEDGLGNSPAETAENLYRALSAAGRNTEANDLKAVYAQHGVQIGVGN